MTDRTKRELASLDESIEIVGGFIIRGAATVPPALYMQLPTIRGHLKTLRDVVARAEEADDD